MKNAIPETGLQAPRSTSRRRPRTPWRGAWLAAVTLLAAGCAQSPAAVPSAPTPLGPGRSAVPARTFDSESWSALSRAGHQAMRPRRYEEAEQSFRAALEATSALPAYDARRRASLGNLVRLAAAYHRDHRMDDAERLMSLVREQLRTRRSTSRRALRAEDLDRTFLALTRTRPAVSRGGRLGDSSRPIHHGFDSLIVASAKQFGLDPALVKAVVAAESNFEVAAVSHAGAQGLMQLMPATSREMGVRSPFDPGENLMGGSRYLRTMLDRYDDVKLALAAYNAGPEAVDRYDGVPPYPETTAYVDRVLRYLEGYREESRP